MLQITMDTTLKILMILEKIPTTIFFLSLIDNQEKKEHYRKDICCYISFRCLGWVRTRTTYPEQDQIEPHALC